MPYTVDAETQTAKSANGAIYNHYKYVRSLLRDSGLLSADSKDISTARESASEGKNIIKNILIHNAFFDHL